MKSLRKSLPLMFKLVGGISTLLLSLGACMTSASAAEQLILQIGPLRHKIKVEDIEKFANTGELSAELKPYSFLLTPQVKDILEKSFTIDPLIAEQFLNDLFKSDDGERLLNQITAVLPNSNPEELKGALKLLLRQTSKLSVVNLLRVYPQETVTIDLSKAASLGIQLNASFLQSQLIAPQLEKALKTTNSTPIVPRFDPTAPGQETVLMETLVLNDRSRDRQIPLDIYYAKKTKGPLVVMSHGFAADRRFLRYLARHLASYGITVVSVEHPGSDINALIKTATGLKFSQILPPAEFVDRPQDISFVLTQLTTLTQQKGQFKGKFNTEQVSMIGHSFGGYTALALGGATLDLKALRRFCQENEPLGRSPADWLQCAAGELPYSERKFKDHRIKQIIVFNPIIGELFGNHLSEINIPTLMLSASEDGITPTIPHQLKPFQQLSGEKYLLVAVGATHMSVTDISNGNSAMGQNTLVREVMGIKAEPLRQVARGVSLAFIQQLTPQGPDYQGFLTGTYIESWSEKNLKFRFGTQLPSSLDTWLNVLNLGHQKPSLMPFKPDFSSLPIVNFQHYFVDARQQLLKPESSTEKLNELFTGLLHTHTGQFDRWS
ncbi:alpha/beta hydrolase [Crocosphaera sp. XPORK-15E]|uniref:alpha/beta hydrolase n=1 Tax=Crocosphaera sp. XPORK-15E TaxID=3110247 RepID=UPI002B21DE41|nr:alpha/beta hydrolase [Crocosphaera sp. XPORK-15E]MEA5533978.1 alpha/beta hydrolase [Crocosphaera sp. XPORK-15E]